MWLERAEPPMNLGVVKSPRRAEPPHANIEYAVTSNYTPNLGSEWL